MLNVGLTGNIASGKSTVAQLLVSLGAFVIDADILARAAVEPGGEPLAAIRKQFGDAVIDHDGRLDRGALGRVVFGDATARNALNAIVHPVVRRLREQALADAVRRGERIVISDIPLLFETRQEDSFDIIVLVDAPEALRLARIVAHRALPAADALAMINAGWPSDRKRARATFVIDNAGTLGELEVQVAKVWHALQALSADHL